MMKKVFLLLLTLSVMCLSYSHADPVTRQRAAQMAQSFFASHETKNMDALTLVYQGTQRLHAKGAPVKDPYFYVFNNGSQNGFVIISGDDCAEEVLGYADHGTFDADHIPENLQAWLDTYAEQISQARANGMKATAKAEAGVDVAHQVIAPMVTAHWNQYAPYNNQCPLYGANGESGNRCITGCVATAFAQVMYYHKWPKEATTTIPSYKSNATIGQLAALPSTTFDWDHMNDVYTNLANEPQTERDAVAKLFRYCGQAVEMDYSPGGSGASTSLIPNALTNYFGYLNEASEVDRTGYSTEDWNNLIYNELRHARPVIYSARTSGDSGHAFVCDGYDGHDLFHINWGWGGMSDGYYRLQALNPNTQGAGGSNGYGGYSISQSAVIGISPQAVSDKAERTTSSGVIIKSMELNGSSKTSFSSANGLGNTYLSCSFQRIEPTSNYEIGLGLFRGDELMDSKQYVTVKNSQTGWGLYWSPQGLGKGLSDGTYTLKLVDRPTGTETWMASENSDYCYISVVISGNEATLTLVASSAETQLEVTNIEQRFERGVNPKQLRAYIHNNGEKAYNGEIYLLLDGSQVSKEGLYLSTGEEDYVDFFFTATAGTHSVALSVNSDGSAAFYTNSSFPLTEEQTAPTLEVVSTDIRNVSGNNQYGRLMEIYLTLKNNSTADYNGPITKSMRTKRTDGYYSVYDQPIDVSIAAGETKTIPFTQDLALGDNYWILIKDANNEYYEKYNVTVQPAFVSWTADGRRTAVAVTTTITVPQFATAASFEDIDDLSGITINTNSNTNPNTLYYIPHTASTPTSLIGRNVVKGYEAEAITLTEGNDFYVPQSFTASTISYTCTPTLGADGKNGWQTITLPFSVQKVTSAGKEVDWFHSPAEEEKDFWLREFTQVSGNVVKFADVSTWMPNTPYIIAVPGDRWGEQYDMTGKKLTFSASDVQVIQTPVCEITSDAYRFIGTTREKNEQNVYVLNEQGNCFELKSAASIKATEGYFVSTASDGNTPTNLLIGFDDTTGIRQPSATLTEGTVDVYNTAGMRMGTVRVHQGQADLSRLPHGIYIIQGTKIIK